MKLKTDLEIAAGGSREPELAELRYAPLRLWGRMEALAAGNHPVRPGPVRRGVADVQTLLAMRPGVTISEISRYLDFMPDLDRYQDNLRRAALPE